MRMSGLRALFAIFSPFFDPVLFSYVLYLIPVITVSEREKKKRGGIEALQGSTSIVV